MTIIKSDLVPVRSEQDIVLARQSVRKVAQEIGFGIVDQTKIVTAASELARNTVVYGLGGEMRWETLEDGGRKGLRLHFVDRGPGIEDVARALTDANREVVRRVAQQEPGARGRCFPARLVAGEAVHGCIEGGAGRVPKGLGREVAGVRDDPRASVAGRAPVERQAAAQLDDRVIGARHAPIVLGDGSARHQCFLTGQWADARSSKFMCTMLSLPFMAMSITLPATFARILRAAECR